MVISGVINHEGKKSLNMKNYVYLIMQKAKKKDKKKFYNSVDISVVPTEIDLEKNSNLGMIPKINFWKITPWKNANQLSTFSVE